MILGSIYGQVPLDTSLDQIRLFVLLPDESDVELRGNLTATSLSGDEPYEALSYMWGPSSNLQTTNLGIEKLPITANLAIALKTLRSPQRSRVLWIDAICIDQSNFDERGSQVQLMRQICRRATQVVVWINHQIPPEDFALPTLNTLSKDSVKKALIDIEIWGSLRPLFKDAYWTRVWIQQEISMAARLTFQFGETTISAYNMFHLFRLFEDRRWTLYSTIHLGMTGLITI